MGLRLRLGSGSAIRLKTPSLILFNTDYCPQVGYCAKALTGGGKRVGARGGGDLFLNLLRVVHLSGLFEKFSKIKNVFLCKPLGQERRSGTCSCMSPWDRIMPEMKLEVLSAKLRRRWVF